MINYDFTLKFDISGVNEAQDALADALYGNGCDDTSLVLEKSGK